MNLKENWYAILAFGVFAMLVWVSVSTDLLVGPDPALTEWTAFAATYAALAVVVHKVWKLGDAAAVWLRKQ